MLMVSPRVWSPPSIIPVTSSIDSMLIMSSPSPALILVNTVPAASSKVSIPVPPFKILMLVKLVVSTVSFKLPSLPVVIVQVFSAFLAFKLLFVPVPPFIEPVILPLACKVKSSAWLLPVKYLKLLKDVPFIVPVSSPDISHVFARSAPTKV